MEIDATNGAGTMKETIEVLTKGGYIATIYRNTKTGRYGYVITTQVGNLYAQGSGRTESEAREECLFELRHAA